MSTPVQTTGYKSPPSKARPGLLADGDHDIGSVSCDEAEGIPPGRLLVRTDNGDYAAGLPAAAAADPNYLITTKAASASGAQNLTSADFNGVGAADARYSPPVRLTVTTNANANWDTTSGAITFPDENGEMVTETLAFLDGGGQTLTTTRYASGPPTAISVPQQTSTAATYEVGISAEASFDGGDVLGVSVREHKGLNAPGFTDNEVWEEGVELGALRDGRINVLMGSSFTAGQRPYVRISGSDLGSFRGDADSGAAAIFRRGRCLNSGSASEYAILEVDVGV